MLATKLYQNNAKVHFNQFVEKTGRFGKRIVYGGHVISLTRAISFNGLSNAFKVIGINGGTHASPCFAGTTVFAWSKIVDKIEISDSLGAMGLLLMVSVMRIQTSFKEKMKKVNSTRTFYQALIIGF